MLLNSADACVPVNNIVATELLTPPIQLHILRNYD